MTSFKVPDFIKKICLSLEQNGFECFLVGGCVRDTIMGEIPHDYDLCTCAKPNEMKRCLKHFKLIETGIKHGTLTILIDDNSVEITTYRVDGEYNDNRHPENVSFTKNIENDLSRRDFTVNSIAYNEKKGYVDLFGGISDIKNKTIRCVGEPNERFTEDGLRILRALRFASTLGFDIDKKTATAIHNNKELLKNISKERIFSEFCKLICGINAKKILLDYCDVVCVFIPEFCDCIGFDQNTKYHCYDVAQHIINTLAEIKPEKKLRLAAFFHDIGKPQKYFVDEKNVGHFYGHAIISAEICEKVLKRFKSDNKTVDYVTKLVRLHDREIEPTEKAVNRFLIKNDEAFFLDLLEIKRADALAHSEKYRDRSEYFSKLKYVLTQIHMKNTVLSLKNLAINGKDLIALGFSGEKIGKILDEILLLVCDCEIENNKEKIIKYIKNNY